MNWCGSWELRAAREPDHAITGALLRQVGAQGQRAILVKPVVTGPTHRISLAFDFQFGLELEAIPFSAFRKHEQGLPDAARHRIAGIETSTRTNATVIARYGDSQDARHAGNAIVHEANNQAWIAILL